MREENDYLYIDTFSGYRNQVAYNQFERLHLLQKVDNFFKSQSFFIAQHKFHIVTCNRFNLLLKISIHTESNYYSILKHIICEPRHISVGRYFWIWLFV